MKNCIRFPFIIGLIMYGVMLIMGIRNGWSGLDDLLYIMGMSVACGCIFSIAFWPTFYFLFSMTGFRAAKQAMENRGDLIHSDCACMMDNSIQEHYKEVYFSGYLFMTPTEMIFQQDALNRGEADCGTQIYYASIANVEKCYIRPKINQHRGRGGNSVLVTSGIRITTKSGHIYKMIVGERNKIIAKIAENTGRGA